MTIRRRSGRSEAAWRWGRLWLALFILLQWYNLGSRRKYSVLGRKHLFSPSSLRLDFFIELGCSSLAFKCFKKLRPTLDESTSAKRSSLGGCAGHSSIVRRSVAMSLIVDHHGDKSLHTKKLALQTVAQESIKSERKMKLWLQILSPLFCFT